MRSLALSLILHGRIRTTATKAKALRPLVERLITRSRKGGLAERRILLSKLFNDRGAVSKLIAVYGKRYKTRPGGYTRITKLPRRTSDGAEMAVIEFVEG